MLRGQREAAVRLAEAAYRQYGITKDPVADVGAFYVLAIRYKLDGVHGVAEAFEPIRSRIRATLTPELAESLINNISDDLSALR